MSKQCRSVLGGWGYENFAKRSNWHVESRHKTLRILKCKTILKGLGQFSIILLHNPLTVLSQRVYTFAAILLCNNFHSEDKMSSHRVHLASNDYILEICDSYGFHKLLHYFNFKVKYNVKA